MRNQVSRRSTRIALILAGVLILSTLIAILPFNLSNGSPSNHQNTGTPVNPEDDEENEAGAVKVDSPDKLAEWEFSRQRDANGVVDPNGIVRGVAQARKLPQASGTALPRSRTAGVAGGGWTWTGPGNVGGRIRAVIVSSANPNTIYLGGIAGGIWKSIDAGQTWTPLNDFLPNMAVSSLAFDPADPTDNTIYAGTGEGYFNADAIRGAGIFKSTNGGSTWTQLASTANSDFYYVNRLSLAHTASGNLMLAATRTGIFRSTDNGASWSHVLVITNGYGVYRVVFNPLDSTRAIAGGSLGTAFYSTDSGVTWTQSSFPPSWQTGSFYNRVEPAYAPSNPDIVYISTYNTSTGSQLWKSFNGGQTYTQVTTNVSGVLAGQSWYANTIAVDPTNPNTIIWSGLDIYRSTDGGSNFTQISDWRSGPPNDSLSAHADHHLTLFPPDYNGTTVKRVYFANDGGLFKTEDISTVAQLSGWVNLNNNLGITQFYGGAGSSDGKFVAGAQDNGTQVYTGNSQTWAPMYGGDGGFVAVDPNNPSYFYGEYVYLRVVRSTSGGSLNSATTMISGLTEANDSANANFIAPFILDPNNSTTMYGGANNLWRSTNVTATTPTWSAVPNLPTITNCNYSPRSCISAIAVAKGNPDIIWVGRTNGYIYYTANGTAVSPTWTRVDTNFPTGTPGRAVNRITIDPNNSSVVYASLGGYVSNNLYKTTNSGASWTVATGTGSNLLPQVPIYSMAVHPTNSSWLYVGTPIGLFASEDGGANWQVSTPDGPNNAPVNELTWVGNTTTLLAVTHGRGLYKVDVPYFSGCTNPLNVTITADSGCGSLRNALTQVANNQTITISPSLTGPITVSSPLPFVKPGVTITGNCSTTTGPTSVIDGSAISSSSPGNPPENALKLLGNNTLYGLRIQGFRGQQLVVSSPLNGSNSLKCVVVSHP